MSDINRPVMLDEYLKPLMVFLDDKELTEITVNRPGELWTECKDGWKRYDVPELSYAHCSALATYVASFNYPKVIGKSTPILSGTLPNGERIQIIIPPCCESGTVSITIRKPSLVTFTLDQLDEGGAFKLFKKSEMVLKPFEIELKHLLDSGDIKGFLDLAVRSERNIIISGKTGSGKTTVAKSLLLSIPKQLRIVTLEDVREMFTDHPNRVHLLYDREGAGGVTSKQAVESCLRMKPDWIILAELRGDEATSFVFALGTDHSGISTLHSNGAYEAFPQLATLIKSSPTGAMLDMAYIMRRLYSTIDIVLHYQNRQLREVYYDPEKKLSLLSE